MAFSWRDTMMTMQKALFILLTFILLTGSVIAGSPVVVSDHWSLQPVGEALIAKADSEWRRNGVDDFIIARLEGEALTVAPRATRSTLIRRVYFDLIGLPPTPGQIDAFVGDDSADAFAKLVDELLASPRYGERWARHWLDVARYTESDGFERDQIRNEAWHYRDYVIDAFNSDKPYDEFITEQIAGDVMAERTSDSVIATSFLVCGSYDRVGSNQQSLVMRSRVREDELEGMLGVMGQAFLGLTVQCARCHDHKFDPISMVDYYQLKSVFDGVHHGVRPIDPAPEASQRLTKANQFKQQIAKLNKQAKSDERDTSVKELRGKLDALGSNPVSYAGIRKQPGATHVLLRGDATLPQEVVTAGAPGAIAFGYGDFNLEANAPEGKRRVEFAKWLTDDRNPLTARVMVNRVWGHHFGVGLVKTPSDFGAGGGEPSHAMLLDYLAKAFIESEYSIKALHRLIVNSGSYQQASNAAANATAVEAGVRDPENLLLWHYPVKRLEGEVIRDAMLAVSGVLNLEMGGPGYRPFDVVINNAHHYELKTIDEPRFNRRTIYRIHVNSAKNPMLDSFDCPDPAVTAPRRRATTTPLQALALMNNPFVQNQARHFADRVNGLAGGDLNKAVRLAYRFAFGREATGDEVEGAVKLAEGQGLREVCWALLNASEFLYVR